MALTKEQLLSLIKDNDEIKKIFELFRLNNLNTITSNYSMEDEVKSNVSFIESYRTELDRFLANGGDPIDIHSGEFKAAMESLGTSDFVDSYDMAEANKADNEMNPLDDPSLTNAQKEGLKAFHKWLYRNADKTGFWGIGNNGSMRDFANNFMQQPAAVQLKALYLLQTGKRKNPDASGLDDLNSQLNYVPDLDKIKKPLIANKWKIWKRANGSHFYWDKLSDSLNQAMENADELVAFRNEVNEAQPVDKANGFGDKAYLKAIEKVIENDSFENAKGEPDLAKKKLFTDMHEFLDKVINNPHLEDETKRNVAEQAYKMLGIGNYKNDKVYTAKGFGDWVQGGILDNEENYYNIEFSMQALLTTLSKDVAFAEAPTIREALTDNSLYAIPGTAFDGLALVGDLVSLVNHGKELISSYKNGGAWQGLSNTMDFLNDIADIGFRGASIMSQGYEIIGEAADKVGYYSNIAGQCFGAYNILSTANSFVNVIDAGRNRSKVSKAIKNLNTLDNKTNDAVAEDVLDIADVSRFINEKKQHGAVRGILKGGMGTSLSYATATIGTVPFLGQAILAGTVGLSAYEQVKEETNRRSIARKVVDTLVVGKDKIGQVTEKFVEKLKLKLNHYDKNSDEYKKISEMIKNQNKATDKIRNEAAVKEGNASLFSSTSNIMDSLGERMMKEVYLIDPKKGFTEDNLITKENQKEVYNKNREKISYKNLLESTGQTVKFESKKHIHKQTVKKYEKELKEKVSGQITK